MNRNTPGLGDTLQFSENVHVVEDVLKDLRADDEIEKAVRVWQAVIRFTGGAQTLADGLLGDGGCVPVGVMVFPPPLANVGPVGIISMSKQFAHSVTDAAAEVESTASSAELVPQGASDGQHEIDLPAVLIVGKGRGLVGVSRGEGGYVAHGAESTALI